jgi:hypothetical protein
MLINRVFVSINLTGKVHALSDKIFVNMTRVHYCQLELFLVTSAPFVLRKTLFLTTHLRC